ncbi:MAG: Tm-1-like ATP-binding domain-containing protein [Deltaproteobacteria bacterium]|nr:MAG: Tm-1-like ATP-binding domain-containing protein [Deltaproteobacteria bacterium]
MEKTILLIATHDTKEEEASYLKQCIESNGVLVMVMDTGILAPPKGQVDISQDEVATRGGMPLKEAVATGDKRECTEVMCRGAEAIARELYDQGRIQGIAGIGGAQGTEIACTAMRALPTGVPRLMASTVANGLHNFGFYVGTKDLTIMHTVSDMQGLNFLTKQILQNTAGAICGMVERFDAQLMKPAGIPVAMSMLGTTTPGALRAKGILEDKGFEVVAFHQNGTGGIAMEDMILEGAFRGVLDLNLHEIGDRFVGGLHGAIREGRLTAAGAVGLPQVVAPGSGNYTVQGSSESLSEDMRRRKHFKYNPHLTLVRLLPDEMREVGKEIAQKLNKAKGPVKVFIPLKGWSFPDREGLAHWEPEGNQAMVDALKDNLDPAIPLVELDAHINDPDFIDPVVEEFMDMMEKR